MAWFKRSSRIPTERAFFLDLEAFFAKKLSSPVIFEDGKKKLEKEEKEKKQLKDQGATDFKFHYFSNKRLPIDTMM